MVLIKYSKFFLRNTKNSLLEKQTRNTTIWIQQAFWASILPTTRDKRQLIQKQKKNKRNYCHKKTANFLKIPKTPTQKNRSLSTSFEQNFSICEHLLSQNTWLDATWSEKKHTEEMVFIKKQPFFWNYEKSNLRKTATSIKQPLELFKLSFIEQRVVRGQLKR